MNKGESPEFLLNHLCQDILHLHAGGSYLLGNERGWGHSWGGVDFLNLAVVLCVVVEELVFAAASSGRHSQRYIGMTKASLFIVC